MKERVGSDFWVRFSDNERWDRCRLCMFMENQLKLMSPGDVGKRLKLSASRVIQLDREGKLLAVRDSAGRRYYEVETVEAYAEKTGR